MDDLNKGLKYKGIERRNLERQVGHNTRMLNNIDDLIEHGDEILERVETAAQDANTSAESAADSAASCSDLKDDCEDIQDECENIKQEIQTYIIGVYKYKGSVATVEDLPDDLTADEAGWTYNVESDGTNYAWTGLQWDALGSIIDLSDYATNQYVNTQIAAIKYYVHNISFVFGNRHFYVSFQVISKLGTPYSFADLFLETNSFFNKTITATGGGTLPSSSNNYAFCSLKIYLDYMQINDPRNNSMTVQKTDSILNFTDDVYPVESPTQQVRGLNRSKK